MGFWRDLGRGFLRTVVGAYTIGATVAAMAGAPIFLAPVAGYYLGKAGYTIYNNTQDEDRKWHEDVASDVLGAALLGYSPLGPGALGLYNTGAGGLDILNTTGNAIDEYNAKYHPEPAAAEPAPVN
jgi:hypothetical protein